MSTSNSVLLTCVFLGVVLVGCGGDVASVTPNSAPIDAEGRRFLLSAEPAGALGVIAAREAAEDGQPLVLVGRIGGTRDPWIAGRAAFTVVDPSVEVVKSGTDSEPGEVCLDDCCDAERANCTTLVKFVDDAGRVVPVDARQLLGVTAADVVVVTGAAKKDHNGNFSLLATGLFVKK